MTAGPTEIPDIGPNLPRRHDAVAGSRSARGLLLTVLGELVLPTGGSAWTTALLEVLGRLGVEPKNARQALMRTGSAGLLEPERLGRRTRWTLTPAGNRLLTEGAERIYTFRATQPAWDERWLFVLTRVPEADRRARHLLRTRMRWAGFGSPTPGVWISTHLEREDELRHVLASAGVLAGAQVFVAKYRGGGELVEMVRQAWDLAAVERGYEAFVEEFSKPSTSDPLAGVLWLVHAWRRFPLVDPALPAALLPEGWSGTRAASFFRSQHDEWAAPARQEWASISEAAARSA